MVHIKALSIGPVATNCYIVHDDQGDAFVVDPGCEYEKILEAARGLRVRHILLTHGHFDHIGGVRALVDAFGAKVAIHEIESDWLSDPVKNLSASRSLYAPGPVTAPPPDTVLDGGESLELLGETLEVRFTPGHSPGHVVYRMGDVVFAGDTLFSGGIGRTDLPGGEHDVLLESIRTQLLTLDPDTAILPGHGPSTTVGREKEWNPWLRSG